MNGIEVIDRQLAGAYDAGIRSIAHAREKLMATATINPADFPDLDIKAKGDGDFEINGSVKILQGFFGRQQGASLADFAKEIKALSTLDKLQLCQGIKDGSFDYTIA